jgi:hypothetical protein
VWCGWPSQETSSERAAVPESRLIMLRLTLEWAFVTSGKFCWNPVLETVLWRRHKDCRREHEINHHQHTASNWQCMISKHHTQHRNTESQL